MQGKMDLADLWIQVVCWFALVAISQGSEVIATDGLNSTRSLNVRDIAIIIRDQENPFHAKAARELVQNLQRQSSKLFSVAVDVLLLQKDLGVIGGWTILPTMSSLIQKYGATKKWLFFCEENTKITLDRLLIVLARFDSSKPQFLGYPLRDREPAIIHHFAFAEDPSVFAYPDFAAGWAVSLVLWKSLNARLLANPPSGDFSIDVQHEIALLIYDRGQGVALTAVPEFCLSSLTNSSDCATVVEREEPNCGLESKDNIFFAVKTCSKFHKDRVPVIQNTLGKETPHLIFFSDVEDETIPTETTGIQNTERGHCAKLFRILAISQSKESIKGKPWVVVVDDDTIMSFSRLQRVLACYDPLLPILMGERYGYAVNYETYGYDYITGGGGMVFSKAAIQQLLAANCHCPAPDTPDDMWLGSCFKRMNIPLVHNPSFHQARPSEYAQQLLDHQFLVSFHKHYDLSPLDVYRQFLTSPSSQAGTTAPKDEL